MSAGIKISIVRELVNSYREHFGPEEEENLMLIWQALGFKKFSDMPVKMQWDFFKYFSEILYDAKRRQHNPSIA